MKNGVSSEINFMGGKKSDKHLRIVFIECCLYLMSYFSIN